MTTLDLRLDAGDAAELEQMLEFLRDWLASDTDQLTASLARFVGSTGYDLNTLRTDLARFAFLLGGNAQPLFGPAQH